MDHITAIVLAAGRGNRMHSDIPKQYLDLCGKPVIYYSLKCFEQSSVDDIVLVTGAEDIEYCREQIVGRFQLKKVKQIVAGGSERYWSVKNVISVVWAMIGSRFIRGEAQTLRIF